MKLETMNKRASERGNVLFLILIAVALFAALSYAVTQSSRSGGSTASSEISLINSSQIAQYPAQIRTAIVRMIINGVDVENLQFNSPSEYGLASFATNFSVFHPNGGGATWQSSPADAMSNGVPAEWTYTADYEIPDIGTNNAADGTSSEVIAFLSGLTKSVCDSVNGQLGITTMPVINAGITITDELRSNSTAPRFPATDPTDIVANTGSFVAQPFLCFRNGSGGPYVFYYVLVER